VCATTDATGKEFSLLRAGGLGRLRALIRITRTLAPGRREAFPSWQGIQYLHDMFSGLALLAPLDSQRYPALRWTPVRDVSAGRFPRSMPRPRRGSVGKRKQRRG